MVSKISFRIFLKFLKEQNLLGAFIVASISRPRVLNGDILKINSIIQQIDYFLTIADNAKTQEARKKNLISALGTLRTPYYGKFEPKGDVLYKAYLKWCDFINHNWKEINEYYTNNKNIQNKEYQNFITI